MRAHRDVRLSSYVPTRSRPSRARTSSSRGAKKRCSHGHSSTCRLARPRSITRTHMTVSRSDSPTAQLLSRNGTKRRSGESITPGRVSARQEDSLLHHRVHNGHDAFEVVDVEILARPTNPTSNAAGPIERRIPRADLQTCSCPGHRPDAHTRAPIFGRAATAMQLKMTALMANHRPRNKAGNFIGSTAKSRTP